MMTLCPSFESTWPVLASSRMSAGMPDLELLRELLLEVEWQHEPRHILVVRRKLLLVLVARDEDDLKGLGGRNRLVGCGELRRKDAARGTPVRRKVERNHLLARQRRHRRRSATGPEQFQVHGAKEHVHLRLVQCVT